MLRIVFLAVAFLGLTSTAFAAPPSLLDGLFKKSTFSKSINVRSIDGPVSITVDLTTQTMDVVADGRRLYSFDVSTGRKGYTTPTGKFRPIRMHEMWYSSKYENSPMPFSIFFHGGYAIHGTGDIKHLGQVASHGCVRLHPDNAEKLYELVKQVGMANTRITLIRS
jgi:lipoprotein-anchoring transpeptidase ErfK/SrfK